MIEKELDLTGKTLGNYKIINRLGKGGMAVVYKAHESSLNRIVALKVLSTRLSQDSDFIKRFQREARAAAQLNHPNIVQIYAIGEEQGIHYFAMEYIKGKTLAAIKRERGLLAPEKAMPYIKQVAEALGEAHRAGLVHRDIKPSNIMVDASGRVKVTDFGIAYVSREQTKLTQAGSIIGTPEYLSPEQCEGKPVDARSDIYSLGVTCYELLTGRTPYEADTPVSMLMKIVKGNFLPIAEANPAVPRPVQKIVEKMMQTEASHRYGDADELIQALDQAERGEPVPQGVLVGEPQEFRQRQQRESNRNKIRALAVAAVIVLLMAGAFAAKVLHFDKKAARQDQAAQEEMVQDGPGQVVTIDSPGEAVAQETAPTGGDPAVIDTREPQEKTPTPPPRNSFVITTLADGSTSDLIASYVQSNLANDGFIVMDGPSLAEKPLAEIARYHLVTSVQHLGTTTLQYYGSSSEMYTVSITMKIVSIRDGKIVSGPASTTVEYTSLNVEEKFQEAVKQLTFDLKDELRSKD